MDDDDLGAEWWMVGEERRALCGREWEEWEVEGVEGMERGIDGWRHERSEANDDGGYQ